jgi:uncharacterized iron-regulated membrane protein
VCGTLRESADLAVLVMAFLTIRWSGLGPRNFQDAADFAADVSASCALQHLVNERGRRPRGQYWRSLRRAHTTASTDRDTVRLCGQSCIQVSPGRLAAVNIGIDSHVRSADRIE